MEFLSRFNKTSMPHLPSGVSLIVEPVRDHLAYDLKLRVPYSLLEDVGLRRALLQTASVATQWLLVFGTVARALGWRLVEMKEDEP